MWWWVKMIREKRTNDAVSPVVGVMLMLVVTIIIAALVSSFASGLRPTHSPLLLKWH